MCESGFGISHGGGGHPGDGAEVSLLVDENFADDPFLCHAHEGGIDDHVAVRMVVSHCFAADFWELARRERFIEVPLYQPSPKNEWVGLGGGGGVGRGS